MTKLYFTAADEIYTRLDEILYGLLGSPAKILRTDEGKPYIEGNPLFFSISHSGTRGVIAVSDRPVGVDLEVYSMRPHENVLKSFCADEQAEILTEADFLKHWTVREAYVKMHGKTLAQTLKSLAYTGGKLYLKGVLQPCELQVHVFEHGVVAVCLCEKTAR